LETFGMNLKELATPCALVNLDVVKANTAHMAERMKGMGVRLRPHVKTHKCVEAARLQVKGHFGGITVSTMAEANFFALAGFRDITYAVPIAPSRIADTIELTQGLDSFNLLLDHGQTFSEMERCARDQQVRFSVFLKVDCGYHRAGVDPSRKESVELAAKMAGSPNLDFRGVLTHAGHAYACRNADEIREIARQEREVLVGFAERIRRNGIDVPEVSVGSTPTMSLVDNLEGVTEARPGNYAFYDRFQASIGSCKLSDAAFSVLVTVVGQYREPNRLVIDGGGLVFSKDRGPTHIDPDCGYGAFFSEDGAREYPELHLADLSQEHGKVAIKPPLDSESFPIGTRLRVVPNHSCLAAALFDRYHVIRGEEAVDEWRPVRGW
jgi:D-serine deaminase-like pyridoxal phosphate-dependent protein